MGEILDVGDLTVLERFNRVTVAVIGDFMLDNYIFGIAERISPEAPVPVLKVEREENRLGGAGNVSANICSLGGRVKAVGVRGDDSAGEELMDELTKFHFSKLNCDLLMCIGRPTTVKTRVIAVNQQVVRIDREDTTELPALTREILLERAKDAIRDSDVAVLSDYAKGVIDEKLAKQCILFAKEFDKPIIIDPKPEHRDYYFDATLMTPNLFEASEMSGKFIDSEESTRLMAEFLKEKLRLSAILITRGSAGASLLTDSQYMNVPAQAKEVCDVTGAGDTIVAMMALCLGAGLTMSKSAIIANIAAGATVGKFGTATLNQKELLLALKESFVSEELLTTK